ncbi:MAG TPA: hypothetical protein VHT75_03400 [Acidimicrobiales bacterium]|nr:hypothetical protein [Acidimicrobiales bacterium]
MQLRAVRALLGRPELWPTATVMARRLAPPGWWRHWPPRPWPDSAYLRFRMVTAYGDADASPPPHDLVEYLAWCRRMNRLRPPATGGAKSATWSSRRASVTGVSPEPPAVDSPVSSWHRRFRQG